MLTDMKSHFLQNHAGILCPHHNCLLMHQSTILSIHSKYVLLNLSGIILIFSVLTASIALFASGFMLMNHCIDIYGSTLLSHLSQ